MTSFSGSDPTSRAWRREQMDLSNDIAGLPRAPYADAMIAALDILELTDEQRIQALNTYFRTLSELANSFAQANTHAFQGPDDDRSYAQTKIYAPEEPSLGEFQGWLHSYREGNRGFAVKRCDNGDIVDLTFAAERDLYVAGARIGDLVQASETAARILARTATS